MHVPSAIVVSKSRDSVRGEGENKAQGSYHNNKATTHRDDVHVGTRQSHRVGNRGDPDTRLMGLAGGGMVGGGDSEAHGADREHLLLRGALGTEPLRAR